METLSELFVQRPPCADLLGWQLVECDAETGHIHVAFEGKREFLNPAGFIQGGILSAMLDDTMGPAVWVKSNGTLFTATIDMNISYLAPAMPGPLFGEGRIVQMGKTIAFLESILRDRSGAPIARATSSARLVPAKQAVG